MSKNLIRGTGAEGWDDCSWLQLYSALADAIDCRSVRDDERGTGRTFLKTILEAAAKWNSKGRIVCIDNSGRPIKANHLRLGAASVKLIEKLENYRDGQIELLGIVDEIEADFRLNIADHLEQEVLRASKGPRNVRNVASVANTVLAQAARRHHPEISATDPRIIQATRGLYNESKELLRVARDKFSSEVQQTGLLPQQTKEEREAEHRAQAVVFGFEQSFRWDKKDELNLEQAPSRAQSFSHMLYHVGGEEAMRQLLFDVKSCRDYLVQHKMIDPIAWSILPKLDPDPPEPV